MALSRSLRARLNKLEQRVQSADTMCVHVVHTAADDYGPEIPAGTVIHERLVVLTRDRRGPWRPA